LPKVRRRSPLSTSPARIRGTTASAQYGGRGICYLEFGNNEVAKVDVTFFATSDPGS